ncbi:MAG TPA: hypothetical protein VN851_11065 [Thermoanaerobaculia bacterium]|nr:hypothetical protein [Thermoanaerobaculia bacterium]
MRSRLGSNPLYRPIVMGLIGLIPSGATLAQTPREPNGPFAALVRTDERFQPREALVPLADRRASLAPALDSAWNKLQLDHGDWNAFLDAHNGFVESAEGAGIPWVSGGRTSADLPGLEGRARQFLADHPGLFGTDGKDLRLNTGRSGPASDSLQLIDFDVMRGDLAVEGARIVFRVGHGRLIQMGSERLPSAAVQAPPVRVTRAEAYAKLSAYVGGFDREVDRLVDRGSLHLLPIAPRDDRFAEGFDFARGYGLETVWQLSFRRKGVPGTWRVRVNATTGEIVEFLNTDLDAGATGGVAGDSAAGTETLRPMPFTDLGGGQATNSAGMYAYSGTPVTSTFNGLFVGVAETCGGILMSSNAAGDLPFGTTTEGNCATPGYGGGGNTRAARTSFYHVNRGKDMARGWLPGNAWLNSQLVVSVNNTNDCNGYWNGSRILLYNAVPGACGASGEEPGFILHEFGHGVDQNDGTGLDNATTEAYADVTAALALHNSCVAPGFRPTQCGSYGDPCTACTGLRDIDWGRHESAVPHTVANYTQTRCGTGNGPCGGEPHCEANVPTEAVWDFANRDLPGPGGNAAWNVLERLWYLSRPTATAAFTCVTGATYTSNGCNVGSWWKTMRALDDDDGNLANGTPHSCQLFAAFDRHGIACATDPGANVCFRGCTQPAAPSVNLADGDNTTTVTWAASGGSLVYDVFRNETGCNSGFTKIADNLGTTSFADGAISDTSTYYYQVVAHPAGNEACHSAPSACLDNTKNAQFLQQSVPTSMVGGQQYPVTVTLKNVGGITWNPSGAKCNSFRLAQVGSTAWNPVRVELTGPVAAGGNIQLNFTVTAPQTAGSYNFQLRMVHECVEFFGAASPNVAVTVGAGSKQAQIVSQAVPASMTAGQPYSATVTVKNVGGISWSPIGPQCNAYRLAQIGNSVWTPVRAELPAALAPGQQATVTINGIAPSTPGTYNFQVEMVHECVEFFGAPGPVVAVNVTP